MLFYLFLYLPFPTILLDVLNPFLSLYFSILHFPISVLPFYLPSPFCFTVPLLSPLSLSLYLPFFIEWLAGGREEAVNSEVKVEKRRIVTEGIKMYVVGFMICFQGFIFSSDLSPPTHCSLPCPPPPTHHSPISSSHTSLPCPPPLPRTLRRWVRIGPCLPCDCRRDGERWWIVGEGDRKGKKRRREG